MKAKAIGTNKPETPWPAINHERGLTDGTRFFKKNRRVPRYRDLSGSHQYRLGVVEGARFAATAAGEVVK